MKPVILDYSFFRTEISASLDAASDQVWIKVRTGHSDLMLGVTDPDQLQALARMFSAAAMQLQTHQMTTGSAA